MLNEKAFFPSTVPDLLYTRPVLATWNIRSKHLESDGG